MEDYIANPRAKFGHPTAKKSQHSPHCHIPINYGEKFQYAAETPSSPPLSNIGKLRIEQLIGAIRYYARAVDNKLLVVLSKLVQQQSSPTKDTNTDMLQLLDYLATYLDDGITYRASDMILAVHYDAAYLNIRKYRSCSGAHIILSEDVPIPLYNGPVLNIAQIIKNVMSSSSEAGLAGLFTISKEIVPPRQSLITMGWPQPKIPSNATNQQQ